MSIDAVMSGSSELIVVPYMDIGRLTPPRAPSSLACNLDSVTVVSSKQRLRVSVSLGVGINKQKVRIGFVGGHGVFCFGPGNR